MNYPKMLYKGDLIKFEFTTAVSEEHEEELKAVGWIEHSELDELPQEPEVDKGNSAVNKDSVALEEYEAVLNERNEALAKITELEKVIQNGSAENIELHRQLRAKELEGQSADELKAILNERGISFGARDSKPELVQLVLKSEQD
ncbi:hypothetical protein JL978_01695 [Acinetobacter baumannii]|uniref:hypothetical protein n=1 Tax=Acinetobacter baumannii TaxID=470 RepID=UPI00112C4E72|nr:hypothetical protein [Acinetobacter baumannii]MBV6571633.1 hypothetical protein [Acinetobacter baumannii]MBV6575748.1 hypothetical protein [Acinetobacter baumannii]TPU58099.1 hypothetical protein FJV29_07085 [Acinetobacter baumannii]HCQ9656011.1 hypothetical protein [Acinetobacter baumannii]HDI2493351.1 hypothetical protein [Acinetobacter baumannii]